MNPDEIIRKLADTSPYESDDSGTSRCFFCVALKDQPHSEGCIWLAASKFVIAPK